MDLVKLTVEIYSRGLGNVYFVFLEILYELLQILKF
jgi:hypothetical protein